MSRIVSCSWPRRAARPRPRAPRGPRGRARSWARRGRARSAGGRARGRCRAGAACRPSSRARRGRRRPSMSDEPEQLVDAAGAARRRRRPWTRPWSMQVLAAGRVEVDAGVLRHVADRAAHAVRVAHGVVAGDERAALVRPRQRRRARAPSSTCRRRSGRAARRPRPRGRRRSRRPAPGRRRSACGGPRRRSRPCGRGYRRAGRRRSSAVR